MRLVLGLIGVLLAAPAFAQPAPAPTSCDTQLQLVELSRRQTESIAAQSIAELRKELDAVKRQLAEVQAKAPKPEAPKEKK